jgi:hypothetical protein
LAWGVAWIVDDAALRGSGEQMLDDAVRQRGGAFGSV